MVGRPSDGPRLDWNELALPTHGDEQNLLAAPLSPEKSSQTSCSSTRSRGRPKGKKARRLENFRKPSNKPTSELVFNEQDKFRSDTVTHAATETMPPPPPPSTGPRPAAGRRSEASSPSGSTTSSLHASGKYSQNNFIV
jgi:hypothetical protein